MAKKAPHSLLFPCYFTHDDGLLVKKELPLQKSVPQGGGALSSSKSQVMFPTDERLLKISFPLEPTTRDTTCIPDPIPDVPFPFVVFEETREFVKG